VLLTHSQGGEQRMKRDWNAEEPAEHWSLLPTEKQLLGIRVEGIARAKQRGAYRYARRSCRQRR
jgi:hypothetical protein